MEETVLELVCGGNNGVYSRVFHKEYGGNIVSIVKQVL